jgi:hypothetical protein
VSGFRLSLGWMSNFLSLYWRRKTRVDIKSDSDLQGNTYRCRVVVGWYGGGRWLPVATYGDGNCHGQKHWIHRKWREMCILANIRTTSLYIWSLSTVCALELVAVALTPSEWCYSWRLKVDGSFLFVLILQSVHGFPKMQPKKEGRSSGPRAFPASEARGALSSLIVYII